MRGGYLLDTSVLTRLQDPPVADRVRQLHATSSISRCSITDLEIGFSARNGAQWDRLAQSLGVFELVEVEAAHLTRASQVQRLLADRGLAGRKVPDLIIAASAESAGATLLHYDADFDHIAAVTGQASGWIVTRGSID